MLKIKVAKTFRRETISSMSYKYKLLLSLICSKLLQSCCKSPVLKIKVAKTFRRERKRRGTYLDPQSLDLF
jgi:hypothetical protein